MLRKLFLAMARNDTMQRMIVSFPPTQSVVHRFIPGATVDECLASVTHLRDAGLLATIDYLGEDTLSADQAAATRDAYLDLLKRLDEAGLTKYAEVSVKLTALGSAFDPELAYANASAIADAAAAHGTTVTLDAEDHTTTDGTLAILARLRETHPETGIVVQAYLNRTLADCEHLTDHGSRVRLCKGAYAEPATVAHQGQAEVSKAFLECLKVLMQGRGYPMVASHDPAMIAAAEELAMGLGRASDSYEFQMLYGIRTDEQRRLADAGHQVRVYVPFGSQWYGYFMRRLAERPANVAFFARALVGR